MYWLSAERHLAEIDSSKATDETIPGGPFVQGLPPAVTVCQPRGEDGLTRHERRIAELEALLRGRDAFIVNQGLWEAFVDQLPK